VNIGRWRHLNIEMFLAVSSCDDNVCVGRLTKEQIKAGYSALQCIADCVDKAEFGARLTAACNDFYTRIPHYFGFALFVHMQNFDQSW